MLRQRHDRAFRGIRAAASLKPHGLIQTRGKPVRGRNRPWQINCWRCRQGRPLGQSKRAGLIFLYRRPTIPGNRASVRDKPSSQNTFGHASSGTLARQQRSRDRVHPCRFRRQSDRAVVSVVSTSYTVRLAGGLSVQSSRSFCNHRGRGIAARGTA
jgi:hypothetical protein